MIAVSIDENGEEQKGAGLMSGNLCSLKRLEPWAMPVAASTESDRQYGGLIPVWRSLRKLVIHLAITPSVLRLQRLCNNWW